MPHHMDESIFLFQKKILTFDFMTVCKTIQICTDLSEMSVTQLSLKSVANQNLELRPANGSTQKP